jgi:hypothetical protein
MSKTTLYEVRDYTGKGYGTYLNRKDALIAASKSGLVRPSVVKVVR